MSGHQWEGLEQQADALARFTHGAGEQQRRRAHPSRGGNELAEVDPAWRQNAAPVVVALEHVERES